MLIPAVPPGLTCKYNTPSFTHTVICRPLITEGHTPAHILPTPNAASVSDCPRKSIRSSLSRPGPTVRGSLEGKVIRLTTLPQRFFIV